MSNWWVFSATAAASTAQAAAFATLPPDTLFTGKVAPIQYTMRWDDIQSLIDGTFAFRVRSGMSTPAALTATDTDAQITPLLPVSTSVSAQFVTSNG